MSPSVSIEGVLDTDVAMLSMAQFEDLCCQELCFSTSGKDKQKFIPVHIWETLSSPTPRDENDFYKTLLYNVQSLEMLSKIELLNEMARSVLNKLEEIKGVLVREYEDWQEWDLPHLVLALKKWY